MFVCQEASTFCSIDLGKKTGLERKRDSWCINRVTSSPLHYMNILSKLFTTACRVMISTTIWRFSFIHCFHCSFAVLSRLWHLFWYPFPFRLDCALCCAISSYHHSTRLSRRGEQLNSCNYFLLRSSCCCFFLPHSPDRRVSIVSRRRRYSFSSGAALSLWLVFGVFRLTPLTFHLELRPGQVAEKILRFFITLFRSLSMCTESKVLRCSTK